MKTGIRQVYLQTVARGFTLVELVAVLVILATLGLLLAPRFAHNDATLPAQADQLGRLLRHTQSLAMSQGRALTLDVQSAASYAITDGATPTPAIIRDPSGEQQNYSLQNGATLAGPDIQFDSLGRPMTGGVLMALPATWTLSGSANSASVSMQPLTGFIAVSP